MAAFFSVFLLCCVFAKMLLSLQSIKLTWLFSYDAVYRNIVFISGHVEDFDRVCDCFSPNIVSYLISLYLDDFRRRSCSPAT